MILAHQKLILLMAFVAIVLAFAKLKAGYHLYSNRAMRLMTLGGMLLIFGATIGLAGVTGVLGAGYSHSLVYFILESVVGYVCGWTLIIWGMSIWPKGCTARHRSPTKDIWLWLPSEERRQKLISP